MRKGDEHNSSSYIMSETYLEGICITRQIITTTQYIRKV